LFSGNSLSLAEISEIGKLLPDPVGRKYALNFALADDTIIDAGKLVSLFSPHKFMVKITPLHRTDACKNNNLKTSGGYDFFTPYKDKEQSLIEAGFDVIVFVPSYDEDGGLITCGNAILSGTEVKVPHKDIEY
jgi:23S rRNA (adenine2503-C2)-methyltransferase